MMFFHDFPTFRDPRNSIFHKDGYTIVSIETLESAGVFRVWYDARNSDALRDARTRVREILAVIRRSESVDKDWLIEVLSAHMIMGDET